MNVSKKYFSFSLFCRFLLVFLLVLILHNQGFSQVNDSIHNRIFTLIYNQQFDQAEKLINTNKTELDPFYTLVLNTDLYWWKYSVSRSKEDAQNLKAVLNEIDNSNENNKIRTLIRKSYELRYERKRYNLIGAMFIRSEINQLLLEIKNDQIPLSTEQLKLFQLYVAMFQYFEFINPFSLFSKPVERLTPLNEMEKFSSEDNLILNTLAHYFLGRIYQKVEKEAQKAKNHFEILTQRFPENAVFKEYVQECSAK